MKDQEFKKAIKEQFKQEAPKGFTQNVMLKVEAAQSNNTSLIPQSVFWILGIFSIIACTLVLLFQPQINLPFSIQNLSNLVSEFLSLLIIPLVTLSLLFIKHIIYYFRFIKTS